MYQAFPRCTQNGGAGMAPEKEAELLDHFEGHDDEEHHHHGES